MEYQEYEIKNKSLSASVQSVKGSQTNEENGARLVKNDNLENTAAGSPSSPLYPIPESTYNSMENMYLSEGYNKEDNIDKMELPLVANPPPHVMTSLGPMPLPVEVRRKIPEKFVAKPIIEEREIYVAKKEVQERTIEIPHIQYDHKFSKIPKMINIKKLVPSVKEIIKEVPREVFKPVEVPCFYPPKIVPRPKEQIVERIVETIKPVVKEKIIEVPQTVVKNVPKIKTVEVPYFVPKYVEKIIEVPYQPGSPNALLPPLSSGMPPQFMQTPFKYDNNSTGEIKIPYEANVNMSIIDPTKLSNTPGMPNNPFINTSIPIELPTGVQWGAPSNAAPLPGQSMPQFLEYPSSLKMPPMMVTFPPEVGHVSYCGKVSDPDILTRSGVMPYKGFKKVGTAQILFPPLPYHSHVPMKDNGVPDVETINQLSSKVEGNDLLRRRTDQSDEYYSENAFGDNTGCFNSSCCKP